MLIPHLSFLVPDGAEPKVVVVVGAEFLLVRNDEVRRLISTRMEEIGFF